MELSVIIAIIRRDMLEKVEEGLREIGVRGITVSKVKGYGNHPNFFARDGWSKASDWKSLPAKTR